MTNFSSIRSARTHWPTTNLRQAATANTLDNFRYVFGKALEGLFIDRMEQNEEIFAKYMNEKDFQNAVTKHLLEQVYSQIREEDLQDSQI